MNLNSVVDSLANEELINSLPQLAEGFRPAVNAVLDVVLSYGPEIKKLFSHMSIGLVDIQADSFYHLVNQRGFTREEALMVVLANKEVTKSSLTNYAKKSSVKAKA